MLKAMPLKSLGFLANGTLLILGFIIVLVILLTSGLFILGGAWLLIRGVLEIAFGIWEVIPIVGSEIKIWDTTIFWGTISLTTKGSVLWGLTTAIAGIFGSAMGWAIFHFVFPEEKKPKRLRRKRKAKKIPRTWPATALQEDA